MILHLNKLKKIGVLTGSILLSITAMAEPAIDNTPHFYIELQNLSATHSVSSVIFSANPSGSVSLENFTDHISLKPLETSQPYGAHLYTKDMNSSFVLTFTGDDGKICTFTTIGHNPTSQSGEGCTGAHVTHNGLTVIFQVDDI